MTFRLRINNLRTHDQKNGPKSLSLFSSQEINRYLRQRVRFHIKEVSLYSATLHDTIDAFGGVINRPISQHRKVKFNNWEHYVETQVSAVRLQTPSRSCANYYRTGKS